MVNVFPLRAQLDTLQRFCDGFLNDLVPREVGYFRVPVPYVMLMLLDYGKLAAQATNFGCFSQREVFFTVPLEWYKLCDGRLVFQDWVVITPFMYVDSEMSMTLGRTAMGWPKYRANLQPQLTGWMQDPTGAMVDVAVSARVLTKSYAGACMEERPLMFIRSLGKASKQVPLDGAGPFTPWTMWSTLAQSALAFQGDFFSSLQGLGFWPRNQGSTAQNLARKARRSLELGTQALPWGPSLTSSTINLKQFRHAEYPREYCYQGITRSPLRFTAFNRGGPLGSAVRGPSGGFTIELNCWPTFPVVDALGLEALHFRSGTGVDVARLTPVLPYWYDANMEYLETETLASRTHDAPCWQDASGRTFGGPESQRYFNTTTGAADPVLTGPFKFPAATLTVFPLLAEREKLRAFIGAMVQSFLGTDGARIEVCGADSQEYAYVYLAILDGGVVSETNNIGDWGALSLTFYIPVNVSNQKGTVSGLYPAFAFASGSAQACTLAELYGVPAIEAQFEKPANDWSDISGRQTRRLLRLSAEALPSLHQGQMASLQTLLELTDWGDGAEQDDAPLSDEGEAFCRLMKQEVMRKQGTPEPEKQAGRVLALGLLGDRAPLHVYTLKQFRDAGHPEDACYQRIVEIPYTVATVSGLEELNRSSSVEVHKLASFPVVETLGLVARDVRSAAGAIVHSLEPVRPFQLRGAISLGNGKELDATLAQMQPPPTKAVVAFENVPALDASINTNPCWLNRVVADLKEKHPEERDAVSNFLRVQPSAAEPQVVLETILSREWEHRAATSTRASILREIIAERGGRDLPPDTTIDDLVASRFARERRPDHCILRLSARKERGRLFPLQEFSQGRWWPRPRLGIYASGSVLHVGEQWTSANARIALRLQGDGNLVLYNDRVSWIYKAEDAWSHGHLAVMEENGNFVLYNREAAPWWSSKTDGNPGAYLEVRNDGNMVIYQSNDTPLWQAVEGPLQIERT
jgi:hypothetical protein